MPVAASEHGIPFYTDPNMYLIVMRTNNPVTGKYEFKTRYPLSAEEQLMFVCLVQDGYFSSDAYIFLKHVKVKIEDVIPLMKDYGNYPNSILFLRYDAQNKIFIRVIDKWAVLLAHYNDVNGSYEPLANTTQYGTFIEVNGERLEGHQIPVRDS